MYKKISLLFMAFIILLFPVQQLLQENQAFAIATKVATKVATEVFKEGVKDMAKEKAFHMALDEVGKIYDVNNTYKFTEGYDGYCVEVKKTDGSCDKPVQIKKELTSDDHEKLDKSVTKKMDAKLGNALYATKFGKWLDYVVPIYAISAIGVTVDYAINGEDSVAGMMNEIAMEALQDAGIIKTVETLSPEITEADGMPLQTAAEYSKELVGLKSITVQMPFESSKKLMNKTIMYEYEIHGDETKITNTEAMVENNSYHSWWARSNDGLPNVKLWTSVYYESALEPRQTSLLKNGVVIFQGNRDNSQQFPGGTHGEWAVPSSLMPKTEKFKTVIVQQTSTKTISSYTTFSGDVYTMEVPFYWTNDNMTATRSTITTADPNVQVGTKMTVFERTVNLDFTPYEPIWLDELSEMPIKPIEQSNFYNHEEKKFYFPPMDSVKYTDSITGNPVTIVKNPETAETGFTDENGVPVHDDQIVVSPGTGFVKNPDGEGVTYTPSNPSPENPTKQPVVVTPTNPTAPPVEPPVEPPVDPNPLPDESGCEEGLKFPRYIPFMNTLSNAFPFSIPWDIQRALEAAFGGIGSERPSFTLDLAFMGGEKTIEIGVPAFFDKWKPFTDGLLLLVFDVGIMFGIYRFMKGGGS